MRLLICENNRIKKLDISGCPFLLKAYYMGKLIKAGGYVYEDGENSYWLFTDPQVVIATKLPRFPGDSRIQPIVR